MCVNLTCQRALTRPDWRRRGIDVLISQDACRLLALAREAMNSARGQRLAIGCSPLLQTHVFKLFCRNLQLGPRHFSRAIVEQIKMSKGNVLGYESAVFKPNTLCCQNGVP